MRSNSAADLICSSETEIAISFTKKKQKKKNHWIIVIRKESFTLHLFEFANKGESFLIVVFSRPNGYIYIHISIHIFCLCLNRTCTCIVSIKIDYFMVLWVNEFSLNFRCFVVSLLLLLLLHDDDDCCSIYRNCAFCVIRSRSSLRDSRLYGWVLLQTNFLLLWWLCYDI